MSQDGFTDLRLNGRGTEVQEGFWPSFTDIMTVVVMIFVIAMVVLLVRNMELVSQLRATMEAERIAAELARSTGAEKDSLSSQLHSAEERVQRMQLEILRLQDGKRQSEALVAEQLRAITGLSNERDDLAQQAAQLLVLRERLEADVLRRQGEIDDVRARLDAQQRELTGAGRTIRSLEDELSRTRDLVAASRQQTERLQQTIQAQREDLLAAQQQEQAREERYVILAEDYDALKIKYDKLVKPARSAAGRRLIEVRYSKQDEAYQIEWREGGNGAFQPIRRDRLDRVLTRLAAETPTGLYVKVIFPENSGLSYNEAFEFTSHLHSNYDYYFKDGVQDPAAAASPAPP